jgi:hypothetical protein
LKDTHDVGGLFKPIRLSQDGRPRETNGDGDDPGNIGGGIIGTVTCGKAATVEALGGAVALVVGALGECAIKRYPQRHRVSNEGDKTSWQGILV